MEKKRPIYPVVSLPEKITCSFTYSYTVHRLVFHENHFPFFNSIHQSISFSSCKFRILRQLKPTTKTIGRLQQLVH